jgi:hypothetical protein
VAYVGTKYGFIDVAIVNGHPMPINRGQEMGGNVRVVRRIKVECIVYRPSQHRNCRIIKSGLDRDNITGQKNEWVVPINKVYEVTSRGDEDGGRAGLEGWGLSGSEVDEETEGPYA